MTLLRIGTGLPRVMVALPDGGGVRDAGGGNGNGVGIWKDVRREIVTVTDDGADSVVAAGDAVHGPGYAGVACAGDGGSENLLRSGAEQCQSPDVTRTLIRLPLIWAVMAWRRSGQERDFAR